MSLKKLKGTWKLVSCVTLDGDIELPFFGKKPKGVLMYDSDGNMAAQFMPKKRKFLHKKTKLAFKNNDWNQVKKKEALSAIMSYQAYYGTYKIDQQKDEDGHLKPAVIHTVIGGIRPNWHGLEEVRFYEFQDNDQILILTTPPILIGGKSLIFKAVWEK